MSSPVPSQRRPRSSTGAALARAEGDLRTRLLTAGSAVTGVVAVQFVLGLVAAAEAALVTVVRPFPLDLASTPVGRFLAVLVVEPWPFYVAALVALVVAVPVSPGRPATVLVARALVAGAAGTLALAVVGLVRGLAGWAAGGSWVGLVLAVTTAPVAAGVGLTAVLVVACVLVGALGGRGDAAGPAQPADDRSSASASSSSAPPDPDADHEGRHASEPDEEARSEPDRTTGTARLTGTDGRDPSGTRSAPDHSPYLPPEEAPR